MIYLQKDLKKFLFTLFAIILFSFVFIFCGFKLFAQTSKASENAELSELSELAEPKSVPKIIKVGYYENEVFQEGSTPDAVKTGYGYEYLQKVASYTGWQYEYFYGSWGELYQAFIKGKVDLLGGLGYSEERLSDMFYPDYPMGYEQYYIYVGENSELTTNPQSFNGKTIGALSGLMVKIINDWLKEKNVVATIKVYNDVTSRDRAIENGEVDAIIGETASVKAQKSNKPLIKISDTSQYLCVTKSRPDILEELNSALSQLDTDDPYYIQDLTKKYFSKNAVSQTLSAKEENWVTKHKNLKVGYFENYLPFSDTKPDGSVTGLVKDVLNRIFINLGIQSRMSIGYKGFSDMNEMKKALLAGEIDVIFPVSDHIWFLEQSGIFQSKPIVSSRSELVYKGSYRKLQTEVFGVNKHNNAQIEYVKTYYPNSKIIYFDSLAACLNGLVNDTVDCTVLSGLRSKSILSNSDYSRLKTISLANPDVVCFAVAPKNVALLSLLDRGINTLSEDFAMTAIYNYIQMPEYSLSDFIEDHFFLVFMILLFIILLIVICVASFIIKSRKNQILRRLSFSDSMTSLANRRAYELELAKNSPTPKGDDFVYIGLDLNGLKKTNDTYGHQAGDELIEGVAFCLKHAFPGEKRIFRTGGDEFCVMLNADKDQVTKQLADFEAFEKAWKGLHIDKMAVSYGVVYKKDYPNKTLPELIKQADREMYKQKRHFYEELGMNRRG